MGQLGTAELAAISLPYLIYLHIIRVFMAASAGVSATAGKALADNDSHKAKPLTILAIQASGLYF